MPPARTNTPPPAPLTHYTELAVHPESERFDPFAPDAIGALREANAWISQPREMSRDGLTYDPAHYNQLVAMLRRALGNGASA